MPRPHRNISSAKKSEVELQLSELRYRRLFETAQDGILILNAISGKIVDANPFLKEILGYSQQDLLGKELWEIGVFKDINESKAAFRELQQSGYIRYKDLPLQTKSGHKIDVEFVSNVYKVGNEQVIQCNIRDISDRKVVEETVHHRTKELELLSKSQEVTRQAMLNVMEDLEAAKVLLDHERVKAEAMLASIGEGLVAVNNDRKITMVNKVAEKMLGWKTKDLIGREITCLPIEDEEGNVLPLGSRATHVALNTGEPTNSEYFFVRKDKSRFPIAISVTPIKQGEKVIGAIDVFRDITAEKEIDKAKSEFVSLASHQLRTPLGISKWYIEAIMGEDYLNKAPKIAKDYLNEIYKSNERLLSLVRDLLSVSRIDQGKTRNAPQLTLISEVIKIAIKEMKILALKNNISIHLKVKKPKIPAIFIDPLRVQETIENLLTNAIMYGNNSGRVDVILNQKDGSIIIEVKDDGVGISDEDKKKMFTKFFRSEKAVSKNAEGSGLGLYVVKSYVDGWGGDISVKSLEGKGSVFTVTLPIKQTTSVDKTY